MTIEEAIAELNTFKIGMEMGYLHRSLSEELSKEVEPQESEETE